MRLQILCAGVFTLFQLTTAHAVTPAWTRQLGTTMGDSSYGVSADVLGNVYITGSTMGNLGGPNEGSNDAFVSKYDAAGNFQWSRHLGTTAEDISYGVSADGLGNVYISGITGGNLGGTYAGVGDAFLSKYNAAGSLQWTRQLGTEGDDKAHGVSADGLGNVYISGSTQGTFGQPHADGTYDAYVSKYDAAGNFQWVKQLGVNDAASHSVSADGLGNVYISGRTSGGLGLNDAFVTKYDALGEFQWTKQLGTTEDDVSYGVSADGLGNVYISGNTLGSLDGPNAGIHDAFVAKYNDAGVHQWTKQLGSAADDYSDAISADGLGSVYVSGHTQGNLGGPNAGQDDAFVSKYSADGALQWTRQLGTSALDYALGVSADGIGNVYISGPTRGDLAGTNAGMEDAYVAKYAGTLPGDYNGNVAVDAADYVIWRDQLGTLVPPGTGADGTNNGEVTPFDYLFWKERFGHGKIPGNAAGALSAEVGESAVNVPEPSSLLLGLVAAGALALSRHRWDC